VPKRVHLIQKRTGISAMTMCRKNDDRSVKLAPSAVANATAEHGYDFYVGM
jgi:hypothetical protein